MNRIITIALAAMSCLVFSGEAVGQTRLSLTGGGFLPFGSLGDRFDASLRVGLRAELQPVDSLGRARIVSLFVYGAFTDLASGDQLGSDSEEGAHWLEAGGGIRVYSKVAPFFLQVGGGYARHRPMEGADARNGFDVHGGLGFVLPLWLFLTEFDIALHEAIFDDDDFQFLSASAAVALPF